MTELWVTSIVIGSWVLAAGLVGIVGSFLAERLGDRQLAMLVAEQGFDASCVEPLEGGEHSFSGYEMTHVTSTTT